MKNNATQQEVLLMTATGFASRQYSEKDSTGYSNMQPAIEILKEACWNGLIKEMLPELFQVNKDIAGTLFLWQVREANQFVALEMGEYPTGVDKYWSIDPYRFMEVQQFN